MFGRGGEKYGDTANDPSGIFLPNSLAGWQVETDCGKLDQVIKISGSPVKKDVGSMELFEKTVSSEVKFKGHIVTVRLDQAELSNGRLVSREVVEHPGGVTILPLHEDNTVTVVRQFRYPFQKVVTELPAGKLEHGEDPRLAALRELSEEAGVVPDELIDLGCIYVSPGITNEVLHMYLARGLHLGESHPDEDEFLEEERIPFATLAQQVMSGEITDGKTVSTVLKVKVLLGL